MVVRDGIQQEGRTLDSLIGRRGLPVSEALKYAIQVAEALGKAHAAGIIHRDLKPGNVMVYTQRTGDLGCASETG